MRWPYFSRKTVIAGIPTELAQTSSLWASVAADAQACHDKGYTPSGGEVVPTGGSHPGGQALTDSLGVGTSTVSAVTVDELRAMDDELRAIYRDKEDWDSYRKNVEEQGSAANYIYESQILDNIYNSRKKIKGWQDKLIAQGCRLSAPVVEPERPKEAPNPGGGLLDTLKAFFNPAGAAADALNKIPTLAWVVGGLAILFAGTAYFAGPKRITGFRKALTSGRK